jgi:hypothetical protein
MTNSLALSIPTTNDKKVNKRTLYPGTSDLSVLKPQFLILMHINIFNTKQSCFSSFQ